jgi:hypothetical protein
MAVVRARKWYFVLASATPLDQTGSNAQGPLPAHRAALAVRRPAAANRGSICGGSRRRAVVPFRRGSPNRSVRDERRGQALLLLNRRGYAR